LKKLQKPKLVESSNLYGEILFDYLEVYYLNHKKYIKMVDAKIQELIEYPSMSPSAYINLGELKEYRASLKSNIRKIER